jgi:hypothetical protein
VIRRFSGERLRRAAKVCACVSLAILAAIAEWPRLGATRGRRPLILGQLLFALTLRNGSPFGTIRRSSSCTSIVAALGRDAPREVSSKPAPSASENRRLTFVAILSRKRRDVSICPHIVVVTLRQRQTFQTGTSLGRTDCERLEIAATLASIRRHRHRLPPL